MLIFMHCSQPPNRGQRSFSIVLDSGQGRGSLLLKVLRPKHSYRRDTDRQKNKQTDRQTHTHSKTQSTPRERGWEECKSWRMRRSSVRCCALDTAWLSHTWTYSSCADPHKIKQDMDPSIAWGQFSDLP